MFFVHVGSNVDLKPAAPLICLVAYFALVGLLPGVYQYMRLKMPSCDEAFLAPLVIAVKWS